MKLIFACPWAKDKKKSWSGTHLGLYNALSDYFDIVDYDTGYQHRTDLLARSFRIASRIFNKFRIRQVKYVWHKIIDKEAAKKINNTNIPVLCFDEHPYKLQNKQYIYLDLCYAYVKKVCEQKPDLYAVSGWEHMKRKELYALDKLSADFLPRAAGIFTMGNWLKYEISQDYSIPEEKIHVVGGGVNVDPSQIDHSKKQGNKVLFVGRDFKRKGGPLVIEAFQRVKVGMPKCELYVAGPTNGDPNIEGIHWLGDVSYVDLIQYFNMCDIFCMPSQFEAYGLVFGEALTYGLPCIGNDAYEMKYFIDEGVNGYLLRGQDADELAALILKALNNQEMQKFVRNNQKKYLKLYSWNQVAKKIYDVIEKESGSYGG